MARTKDQDLLPWVLSRRERIMSKVEQGPSCWLWTGAKTARGYGQVTVNASRTMRAHRALWMLHHGKTIPDGMTLDHNCRNTRCVNPKHLEPVTFAENIRRGAEAREGGASIRERTTAEGATRYVVLFREPVDGKIRQRSRTFGSRKDADQFREHFLNLRFTHLPKHVWETA